MSGAAPLSTLSSVPEKARVVGIPATPEREQMVKQAALAKLPEMRRQLKKLKQVVDRLVESTEGGNGSTKQG